MFANNYSLKTIVNFLIITRYTVVYSIGYTFPVKDICSILSYGQRQNDSERIWPLVLILKRTY